jgi:two-component system, sensor histidine kinase PdtaS
MNRLRDFLSLAASAGSEGDLLSRLSFCILRWTEFDSCDLFLKDHDGLRLKATTTAPEYNNRVRLGKHVGIVGRVIRERESLFIEEKADTLPEYAKYAGIDETPCEACAALLIPGVDADDDWGVCMLRSIHPREFSAEEVESLRAMAIHIGEIIRTFNNAYAAGARANRLGALSEVTRTISESPYIEEILQLLVHLTAQQFNYVVCTVRLLDEAHQELVLRATQAPAKAYARKRALRMNESIAGRALTEGKPIVIPDVQREESYVGHDLAVEQGLRSMICVPLTIQERAIGVLSCYTGEVRDFAPDEIKALETLAKQAAVSIEHAKLQVRSTLMQEMHHRVKNNLQQIASLLRLQMRQKRVKSLEESLNDTLSRILAISSVHDLLSREDLDHVGIRNIAEALVQHQTSSLIEPERKIEFLVKGDDFRLNMAQATQVALILNELIHNAVEHGFAETQSGNIHVTIEANEAEVSLWVSNDGDQLPPDFDLSRANLGLQIVDNLARSLGGKFKISTIITWTVAEVKFPRMGLDV